MGSDGRSDAGGTSAKRVSGAEERSGGRVEGQVPPAHARAWASRPGRRHTSHVVVVVGDGAALRRALQ